MEIQWTNDVVEKLAEGYNMRYGARSIKHEVERSVINKLAHAHEFDELKEGNQVLVYLEDGQVKLKVTTVPTKPKSWLDHLHISG